ncbi:MAG: hypothetical protein J6B06_04775, partial [Lachnospiraceae bacterium]|nr:hypothetical protein [Lachnospiraceae bacterium]
DQENPDIGSVIAFIFASQMGENVRRFNMVLDNYYVELINMLGISLQPAQPASVAVILNLASDTVPGLDVPKGTRLLGWNEEGDNDSSVIFETEQNIHVTDARLSEMFMVSKETGKVIPVTDEFTLFDFSADGIGKNALLLYHSSMFDIENENIYLKLPGGEQIVKGIAERKYRISYYAEEGLIPVELCGAEGEMVVIQKDRPCKKIAGEDGLQSLLVLESRVPVTETIEAEDILISSSGDAVMPEFVSNGTTDLEITDFKMFGDTLALYEECYIGHSGFFSKPGAVVTIQFDVAFEENYVSFKRQEEAENLKIIKRRPRNAEEQWVSAYAQEVSIEYYNGVGWKRLECQRDYKRMFAEAKSGTYELNFICPEDWAEAGIGGYQMPCIRIQLLKSDNCYMQPCIHCYPRIRNMTIAYTYEGQFKRPEKVEGIYGTQRLDVTKPLMEKRGIAVFSKGRYEETALYLGFDRKFDNGPISLWFDIEENSMRDRVLLEYSYSTIRGFKPMKVLDGTRNMTSSGMIFFIPQSDMAPQVLEDKELYWIKISLQGRLEEKDKPHIRRILLNAVEARNVETLEEEEFYIDQAVPDMQFALNAQNILSAEVWVNETGSFSDKQISRQLSDNPDGTRAVYNFLGEIEEFYVKWQEVSDFSQSLPRDRHYVLDRMNNKLIFGDGVHVMIPQMTKAAAFKVTVRCSAGQEGNVEAYRISDTASNLLFIDNIYNPIPAFGGSNMETLENALKRGSNILSARHRLVTETDYVREVKSFSDTIDKVRCVIGKTVSGVSEEDCISLVLLMKDYQKGSYSFHKMKNQIWEHLMAHCEISVEPACLHIVEPVFVDICVNAWVEVFDMENAFEIREIIEEFLRNYLSPVRADRNQGWDIGVIPKTTQIMFGLNVIKEKAVIRQIAITAKYRDDTGIHETDLQRLPVNPFFVCRNGEHRIYVLTSEQR